MEDLMRKIQPYNIPVLFPHLEMLHKSPKNHTEDHWEKLSKYILYLYCGIFFWWCRTYFEGEKAWDLDFHNLVWGKELEELSTEQLKSADMIIYGKKTYEGMADYWSKAEGEIAGYLNKMRKAVCSTTLKTANWTNTTILRDAQTEIPKLKQQGDGNIFVFGSGILSESLMKSDLFDEYRLCVAPVFLGKGRQLFNEGLPFQKLKLLEARRLQTGGVILKYTAVTE